MPTIKKPRSIAVSSSTKTISVAQAKANLSSVLDKVQKSKSTVTILRRGIPVAQIIPVPQSAPTLYGSMRGTVQELGDIIAPTGVEWIPGDE